MTGASGAGKSSLALDTLYAEGHRRYVETFSPYTRQFLARLDKPPAEMIAGIPPAIAVGQPHGRDSPRSTVGTITEIHATLGLLFARAGQVFCRQCGELVAPASPATVSRAIEEWPAGTRYEIGFPAGSSAGTDQGAALLASLRARGFTRLRVNGQTVALDGPDPVLPDDAVVEGFVDRLVRGSDSAERRADSIETAFDEGLGRCRIIALGESRTYVRGWTVFPVRDRSHRASAQPVPLQQCLWVPARSARASAGPWSSTWAGSFPIHPGRSGPERSRPGPTRLIGVSSMN